jgi:polyhydroxyalkanoate synthase subunit PhaE
MENTAKKMFETMANMQKQAVDSFNQMSENMTKNVSQNPTIDSEFFKKWYDSQMAFFNQNGESKLENNPLEFFNTWMNTQMESAKTWFEQSKNNMGSAWTSNADAKKSYDQSMEMFTNWMNTLNGSYGEMMKNFGGASDAKDSFAGMFNNAQSYMKMFEIWMPMMKAVQDKSFTPDMFKNMLNTQMLKGMMDSMFHMQPDFIKSMTEQFNTTSKDGMNKIMDQSKGMYENFKNSMNGYMPNSNEAFGKFNEMYSNFYNSFNNAAAPLMKLVTPGTQKDQMDMMNDMSNEFNLYNMKNSQMQYMMYITGLKAMEEVADSVYSKIRNGEDMSNFMNVYQEWLTINDKNFVSLFDSEDYSKMQSELNSFGMKLKHKIDLTMEKSLGHLPLINRTEMDELYKTIYELRKRISVLEKENTTTETPVESVAKPTAKKTGKTA